MRRSSEPIRDRDQAGFTLIELLVALAVLAVSTTAIGALMATNNRGTLALDQRLAMVEATRADELMITTMTYDHAARRRSYELLAAAFAITVPPT